MVHGVGLDGNFKDEVEPVAGMGSFSTSSTRPIPCEASASPTARPMTALMMSAVVISMIVRGRRSNAVM